MSPSGEKTEISTEDVVEKSHLPKLPRPLQLRQEACYVGILRRRNAQDGSSTSRVSLFGSENENSIPLLIEDDLNPISITMCSKVDYSLILVSTLLSPESIR